MSKFWGQWALAQRTLSPKEGLRPRVQDSWDAHVNYYWKIGLSFESLM